MTVAERVGKVQPSAQEGGSCGESLQRIMADKETIVKISATGNLIQCSAAIDILLLIDGSYSIGKGSFERSKHFAVKMADVLDINPDRVRIGAIQYSSKPKIEFALNDYPTREEAKEAIKNIRFRGGSTESGKAIKHVLRKGFPGGRRDTSRILIILTDGKSQDNIKASAVFARKSGIKLFAVGIRHPKWDVLHAVASEPSDMYVFFAEHYNDAVNGLITTLTQIAVCNDIPSGCRVESRACLRTTVEAHKVYQGNHMCWKRKSHTLHATPMAGICPYYRWKRTNITMQTQCHRTLCPDPCDSNPCQNGGTCITESVEDFSCLCPLGYGGDQHCVPAGLVDCAVDLLFLVDGSWSMGLEDFLLAKDFIKRVAQTISTSAAKILVAVAQYGDQVVMEIPIGRHSRLSELMRAIDDIGFRGGNAMTGNALRHVAENAFRGAGGYRMEVPHVLVLLSNSKPRDVVAAVADGARQREIFILAVSSSRLQEDMARITGDPDLVFTYTHIPELHSKVQELRTKICGINTPGCHSKSLDLVFLLDASGNVARHDFLQIKGFVRGVISQFDIDADLTQVALVIYGERPRTVFGLNALDSEGKMRKAVSLAPYLGRNGHTGRALLHVLEDTLSVQGGARPGVHKVVVVITDGRSADDVTMAADELRESGITVLAMGPGAGQSEALLRIAGIPRFMIPVPSYDDLKHYATNLVNKICKDIRPSANLCVPNPCRNGGVCVQENRSYSCQCVGWGGAHCERRISGPGPA
ncbi:von Willebrand factor A domain-containing protein 2-like [Megalops cyprinoides]|uniref:von Willebrand factor A domain-containing protein 2-like n=1 Tax=Megalops cyprinoides TaxID=118141 RepID=UPI00186508F0|nr:von Willebrand factor A domain-containing protein 2-like [Megalops cyprinoides]